MSESNFELTELAAKAVRAAGYAVQSWVGEPRSGHWWSPLGNDEDALRLMTQLNIDIEFIEGVDIVMARPDIKIENIPHRSFHPDKMDAVRRVIVMAAAEIGRSC
jgi:hypothetical protein